MTDYINPDKLYPEDTSRRIDRPPGFDSVRTPGGASQVVIDDNTSHIAIGGGAGEQVKSIVKALRGLADALAALTE